MKNETARKMAACFDSRNALYNVPSPACRALNILRRATRQWCATKPLHVVGRDVYRTIEDGAPLGESGVEVRMRYDNCFQPAFRFDLEINVREIACTWTSRPLIRVGIRSRCLVYQARLCNPTERYHVLFRAISLVDRWQT